MSLKVKSSRQLKRECVDSILHGLGYNEVVNYSFVSPSMNSLSSSNNDMIDLQNPISIEMSVMRNSLWPGLLNNLSHNINRQHKDLKLYEIGKRFSSHKNKPIEKNVIAGLIYGNRRLENWGHKKISVDFFDIKGHLEDLFGLFQIKSPSFKAVNHEMLCPGVAAGIYSKGKKIGTLGMLNPELSKDMKIEDNPFIFEIDYEALCLPNNLEYKTSEYHPSSRRDLSFLIPNDTSIDEVLNEINNLGLNDLREIIIFDLFDKITEDIVEKSISIGLIFQARSRTLKDQEIDKYIEKVIKKIESSFKIKIRK